MESTVVNLNGAKRGLIKRERAQASDTGGSVHDHLDADKSKRLLKIECEIEQGVVFEIKKRILIGGRLLCEAKELLPHGWFKLWIEQCLSVPYSTGHRWMKVFQVYGDRPEIVRLLPVSMLLPMTKESFPEEIRELVEENREAFAKSNVTEFLEAHSEFKSGKITEDDFLKLAKQQIEIGIEIVTGKARVQHSRRAKRTIKHGLGNIKSQIRKYREVMARLRDFFPPTENFHNPELEKLLGDTDIFEDIDACILEFDEMMRDADAGIKEMNKLKDALRCEVGVLFRDRLVSKDGVVTVAGVDPQDPSKIYPSKAM